MRNVSKKKILAAFLLLIIYSAYMTYLVYSPDLSFTTVLEQGSMNTESTFVVFKDGTTYYLRDGETGEITDSNTNASDLFYDNMDNYTTFTIKTPYGSYDPIYLTAPILLLNNTRFVTFQGESDYGIIQLANGANCDMFQIEDGCHWLTWRGLYLHGNDALQGSTSHGIHFLFSATATSDIEIVDCAIVNFNGSPIYFEGTVSASYIRNNYIEDSVGACIRVGGLHGTTIEYNLLWNSAYGIQIESTSLPRQDNIIVGNMIDGMSAYGIFLNTSHNNIIKGNRVSNSQNGTFFNLMYYSEVQDNYIITIEESGMVMYSIQFTTVSDNVIMGCSQETNDTYTGLIMGAIASGQCHSNVINGNMISNTNWTNKTAYGVYVAGNYNIMTDNHVTGSDCPIFESGTNEVHDSYNGTTYIA